MYKLLNKYINTNVLLVFHRRGGFFLSVCEDWERRGSSGRDGCWAAQGSPGRGEGLVMLLVLSCCAREGPGGLGSSDAVSFFSSQVVPELCVRARISGKGFEEHPVQLEEGRRVPPRSGSHLSAFTFPCWLGAGRDSQATSQPRAREPN